jgi:large subunit ribosomal protein L25
MDTTLPATPRSSERGKTATRKVRKAGSLPAVVYGGNGAAKSIQVDTRSLTELFRKTNDRNTIVELQLEGETLPCIVREVQRHPLSRELVHVDFIRVTAGAPVLVQVPVAATGKAKGLAMGGRIQVQRRALTLSCPHDKIPKVIEIDATELDVGDSVRVSAVAAPSGTKILFDTDYPVVTCLGKQKEKEEAPAAAAPAEGAEAAAAPAADAKGKKE